MATEITTNTCILLVDDDPDDLFMLSDAFRTVDASCEIVEAYDGDAALLLLEVMYDRRVVPDLWVLDINMHVLDGRELLRILKTSDRYKDVLVVVHTTSSNPFDRLRCQQYGVELIPKPYTIQGIEQAVQDMLRHCTKPAA